MRARASFRFRARFVVVPVPDGAFNTGPVASETDTETGTEAEAEAGGGLGATAAPELGGGRRGSRP